MSRGLKIALPIAFLSIAVLAATILIQSRPAAMQRAVEPPSLLVNVIEASREPVVFRVASQGSVTPRTATVLVSEVAGQIVEVDDAFVNGGMFTAGDVLLRIDPRNYENQVKRARAERSSSASSRSKCRRSALDR